jgi:hypothetical protein
MGQKEKTKLNAIFFDGGKQTMSGVLRIMLLIAAVFSAWWILLKIRKCKVKMEDAIFWVCFCSNSVDYGHLP